MNIQTLQSTLALVMSLHLFIVSAPAATPAIGTVLAPGSFRVDHATILGNATLFEGSVVETARVPSSLQLNTGARVALAADSRGRLFGDRLVLERGGTDLQNATGFRLVALGLTIQPDRASSTASVIFESPRRLRVSASTGAFRVLNSSGQLVANLAAGSALAFEPQQGASNAARVLGCLQTKSGHYLMTDEVTNVTVELAGDALAAEAGNRVEVTGVSDPASTPAAGASQLIRAREVRRLAKGCGRDGVAAAAGTGGVISSSGGVAVTTVAIVGGVAAAAVVGGLAARDTQREAPPAASR